MARFTPVGPTHGLKYKITFQVKGAVISRSTGKTLNMPEQLAAGIAKRMQEAAAEHLDKKIKRPNASTGRLRAAILSRHNREVKGNTLRVMLPSWLDQEVFNAGDPLRRPYWRAIDQGSYKAVGRRLAGVFAEGDEAFPLNRSIGNQRFLGPRHFGRNAARKGRQMLVKSRVTDEAELRTLFRISRPIRPVRFSEAARNAFDLPENAARQIFKEVRSEVIVRRR